MKKTIKTTYTRKQILESIRYWQKQLRAGNYKKVDESKLNEAYYRDLSKDKASATAAILKHNDEIYDFAQQDPKPTKDELVQFVEKMFKEEGIDTPWSREFITRMKTYVHGFDNALSYLFNAKLKGQGLGMDRGKRMHESETTVETAQQTLQTLISQVNDLIAAGALTDDVDVDALLDALETADYELR